MGGEGRRFIEGRGRGGRFVGGRGRKLWRSEREVVKEGGREKL